MLLVSSYLYSFTVAISSFKVMATEVTCVGILSYIHLNTGFYLIALGRTTQSASVMIAFEFTEV